MGADSCNLQLEELEKVFYGIKYSTDSYHSLSSVHFAFAGVVGLILMRQDFWIFLVPCWEIIKQNTNQATRNMHRGRCAQKMINWSEEIVKRSSSPESPSQLWLWQRIANSKYKIESILSRLLTSIALQIDVWMDMIFLAFHVENFMTFMRHLCCKCRKSGFVKLEFPYFMCSSQTPWWNYFSSHYLTILWYPFQIHLNSHFMFAHGLISIPREGQDLLELIMGRFPLKASPLLLWESFLETCQDWLHAQRPWEDGKGRQVFWGLPFLVGKPWNQILQNSLAHSSMLLSSNNLYNKFGNKSWWQWETTWGKMFIERKRWER